MPIDNSYILANKQAS